MLKTTLADISLTENTVLFGVAALGIWLAGAKLSAYADEISDRKRIGKAIMGLVFLAAVTELPEMVTTFTAALQGNAAFVLNNMFGGITLQTAILIPADIFVVGAALSFYPRKPTPALEAALLIALLTLVLGISLIGEIEVFSYIGVGSIGLAIAYFLSIYFLRRVDGSVGWIPVEVPDSGKAEMESLKSGGQDEFSTSQLIRRFCAAGVVILICGVLLVAAAENIADKSGLGSSFVGATLLAGATSLPELSTTLAAVRLGAYTMAISNIFGSNLIMLALLLPADMLYSQGAILRSIDKSAEFALISGIFVTTIYLVGLLARSRRRVFGMGWDSLLVLCAYIATLGVLYHLRGGP